MVKIVNYVEFFSPGTFVSESSTKKIKDWDIKEAVKISKKITERHNAKPFGFRFKQYKEMMPVESQGEKFKVEPKFVKESGMHYLTGKVMTLKDVPDTKENRILRDNMRCNEIKAIVENNNSWKYTGEFHKNDVVVDWDGDIIDKGSNYI